MPGVAIQYQGSTMNDLYQRNKCIPYLGLVRVENDVVMTEEEARRIFIRKYKKVPQEVIIPETGPIALVGPIEKVEDNVS